MATEQAIIIQFLVALVAPFFTAYILGWFIRKSLKYIAGIFGFFFLLAGIFWYFGYIDSFSPVQNFVSNSIEAGFNRSVLVTEDIGKRVDAQNDAAGQMLIVLGSSSFLVGLLVGVTRAGTPNKGLRITSD
jgi:hypothetical protein